MIDSLLAGALPGQKIDKDTCQACAEFEAMLSKTKSPQLRKQEMDVLQELCIDAVTLRKESEKLDIVVTRQLDKLTRLQTQLKAILDQQEENVASSLDDFGAQAAT